MLHALPKIRDRLFPFAKPKKKPILISIPHASFFVPKEIRDKMLLSDFEIRKIADLFTDELFDIPGCYIVKGKISRLVADVNRAPDDIESQARLGDERVVVDVTEDLRQVYAVPPTLEMIVERIKQYHDTFHAEIEKFFPKVKFLIDGHSMRGIGPTSKADAGNPRPDISLGNRGFTTCDRRITKFFVRAFEKLGYSVKVNDPYEGKYIIGCHCSRKYLPGIQIEINRRLYLNQSSLNPNGPKIQKINGELRGIVEELLEIL